MIGRLLLAAGLTAFLAGCSAPPIEWTDLSANHPANPAAEAAIEDAPTSLFGKGGTPAKTVQPAKPKTSSSSMDHSGPSMPGM